MNDALEQNDEEISLVDLFAVLVRYRKLIGVLVVFTLALAVAGYFFYPVYQYNNALKNRQIQGRSVISVKTAAQPYVSQSLASFFNNAQLVVDSLREAGVDTFEYDRKRTVSLADETERTRALFLVDRRFFKNMKLNGKEYKEEARVFKITAAVNQQNSSTVEITFKNKDAEVVKAFLYALFVRGGARVGDSLRPFAETMVSNYERFMNSKTMSESMRLVLEKDFESYIFLKDFLDGKESLLMEIGEPLIAEPEILLAVYQDGYLVKGLLLVFAGFFFTVFLAFALNAVRSIKNDEEAMGKIRDALGRPAENNK
jgi:hypothetical protein